MDILPDILPVGVGVGVGVGAGAGAGIPAEAACRWQVEVVVVKLVYVLPYRLLCNLINKLKSK